MKKKPLQLFVIFITLAASLSCKQKETKTPEVGYIVTGTVTGLDNGTLKLSEYTFFDQDKASVIQTAEVVDGKFTLKGKVDFSDVVSIAINDFYGTFFLENSAIELHIDVTDLNEINPRFMPEVKGSKSHDELKRVQDKRMAVFNDEKYKPLEEIRELYTIAKTTKKPEDLKKAQDKQKELDYLFDDRYERMTNITYNYVRQNPGSTVAPHVMSVNYGEGNMSRAQLKEFYDIFKGDARKTGLFKHFITKIYKDNFENMAVGNTVPDFTLKAVDGNNVTLTKVDAKYKLVDFWASWCIPCRASFPHLKELRKKYLKDGFEIVGIGTLDEEAKWKKAIEEDQTPWIHVLDENEDRDYGPVAKQYGVPFLPTTFLVDANHTILLRNPSKEELDNKLKELFKH